MTDIETTGTAAALGYRYRDPNIVQRAMQRFGASKPGAWVFKRTLHPIDAVLFRVSGGRVTLPALLGGLPVIMVTTTGAKSGQPRTTPLLGIPIDGDLAIIGSNFGQEGTPGWVYNLEADPTATVAYRDVSLDVQARLADATQADRAFTEGAKVYPGYPKYRERASHRTIRVFMLGLSDG